MHETVTVHRRSDDYHAACSEGKEWGCGSTVEEAVRSLWQNYPKARSMPIRFRMPELHNPAPSSDHLKERISRDEGLQTLLFAEAFPFCPRDQIPHVSDVVRTDDNRFNVFVELRHFLDTNCEDMKVVFTDGFGQIVGKAERSGLAGPEGLNQLLKHDKDLYWDIVRSVFPGSHAKSRMPDIGDIRSRTDGSFDVQVVVKGGLHNARILSEKTAVVDAYGKLVRN